MSKARKILEMLETINGNMPSVDEIIAKAEKVLKNPRYFKEFMTYVKKVLDAVEDDNPEEAELYYDQMEAEFWAKRVTDEDTWAMWYDEILAGDGAEAWQEFMAKAFKRAAKKLGGKYPSLCKQWLDWWGLE